MKNSRPQLSIVVPFYNEEKNIPLVLNNYKKAQHAVSFELICVNNGSTDNSQRIFDTLLKQKKYKFAKVVTIKRNIGYGYGITCGLKRAKGDILAWTHADMQTDAKDVFRAYNLYKKFDDATSIVKGRRIKRNVTSTLFSMTMAVTASMLLGKLFYEINAQPKLFHRSFLNHLKNPPNDFSFDLYFLLICKKYYYNILSIPVKFPERRYGVSTWSYSFASRIKTMKRTIEYIFLLRKK
jgi:glycosyltransferase involved in cell wall biosynthesis